jgi:hypothetical protein
VRALALVAVTLLLAGCGGAKARVTHHQPRIVDRLSGKAAERVGATACKHLPRGLFPANASKSARIAAVRSYLQSHHPTDDVQAMVEGCRAELHL